MQHAATVDKHAELSGNPETRDRKRLERVNSSGRDTHLLWTLEKAMMNPTISSDMGNLYLHKQQLSC
jgi:hypothetical protein